VVVESGGEAETGEAGAPGGVDDPFGQDPPVEVAQPEGGQSEGSQPDRED